MATRTIRFAGGDATVTGNVVCDGPKAIVLGARYREIYLKDSNGNIADRHSHGYQIDANSGDDGWMPYFRSVCGEWRV